MLFSIFFLRQLQVYVASSSGADHRDPSSGNLVRSHSYKEVGRAGGSTNNHSNLLRSGSYKGLNRTLTSTPLGGGPSSDTHNGYGGSGGSSGSGYVTPVNYSQYASHNGYGSGSSGYGSHGTQGSSSVMRRSNSYKELSGTWHGSSNYSRPGSRTQHYDSGMGGSGSGSGSGYGRSGSGKAAHTTGTSASRPLSRQHSYENLRGSGNYGSNSNYPQRNNSGLGGTWHVSSEEKKWVEFYVDPDFCSKTDFYIAGSYLKKFISSLE